MSAVSKGPNGPRDPTRREGDGDRRAEAWRVNVVQYSLLRAGGFVALFAMAAVHLAFLQPTPPWETYGWLVGVAAVYCLGSWLFLRACFGRWGGFHVQLVPLNLDMVLFTLVVYVTGSEHSWMFFVLIGHVADQTNTNRRRTLWFAHLGTAAYLALMAWRAGMEGASLYWPGEVAKALFLYVHAVYWSFAARTAENLRLRTREAVRVARELIDQLRQRTAELDEERRRAEQASEAKSAFLAAMTHELRTPLHAILGFSQLLQEADEPLTGENLQFVEYIRSSGTHLLALINDVLDLVKVEQGRSEVSRENVDLPAFMEGIRHAFEVGARDKGLDLSLDLAGAPQALRTDARRLRQILFNLVGNAVDFTPPGGLARLSVTAEGGLVRFVVSDTGVGIPTEFHERVFEDFFQVGRTSGRAQKGTGLGLALTRRLVRLLGGTIRLQSAPGEGATFTVEFPLEEPSGPTPAPEPEPTAPVLELSGSVLVVEDNPLNMQLLERMLERQGLRVLRAVDGRQGLEQARSHRPDLVLMDLQLPDVDGLTVTRRLKEDPLTRDIPVVAVTARSVRDDDRHAVEAGCDGYLVKPIDREALTRCMERFLA